MLSRRQLVAWGVGSAAATALVGCSSGGSSKSSVATAPSGTSSPDFSARFATFEPSDEPNGELALVEWPSFVTEAGPEVRALYEFQITHGELMRFMPCFCGCGGGAGHRNNRDCYVRQVNPDGSVVLDSMAPT